MRASFVSTCSTVLREISKLLTLLNSIVKKRVGNLKNQRKPHALKLKSHKEPKVQLTCSEQEKWKIFHQNSNVT